MYEKYLPVDPYFYELIEKGKKSLLPSHIHYFTPENRLKEYHGMLRGTLTNKIHEEFLLFASGEKIRLDRIIAFDGKPGPAFDEYDSYALACLDCTGGMD